MLDERECRFGLDPFNAADALADSDEDGITNHVEFALNSNPTTSDVKSLVGHWPLDGSTLDTSGNNHNGTDVNTPSWTTNAGRPFVEFTSAELEHIEIPGVPSIHNGVTVACWARSGTEFWNVADSLVSRRTQWGLHPWLNPPANKKFSFMLRNDSGEKHTSLNLSDLPSVDLRDWHHYAATYDAETGQAKVYIDGWLEQTLSLDPGELDSSTGSLWIRRDSTKARYFEGAIDEVFVYDYPLAPDEILALTAGFDDDQDGMDDATERAIIRHNPNDQLVALGDVLPTDDYDSDGSVNTHEAKAGTPLTFSALRASIPAARKPLSASSWKARPDAPTTWSVAWNSAKHGNPSTNSARYPPTGQLSCTT